MRDLFINLIGTLSVILVVAFLIGGSNLNQRLTDPKGTKGRWRYVLLLGLTGGLFGVYGNLSGVSLEGAVISVRDMGPMLSGFLGGPLSGLIAGLIAGGHRLLLGGITAQACVVATCCIGLFCGLLSSRFWDYLRRPLQAFVLGAGMEAFHLCVVLVMVRPFETALSIVRQIALPFILANALGFTLLVAMLGYIQRQRDLSLERSRLQSELKVAKVIQRSLLPPISDRFPGRQEAALTAFMEPAKQVGGDFYDFFFLDKDRLALVIADVSGKGIPAALFMVNAKQTIQNCVRDIPDLAQAIMAANDGLCAANEAEMFVTAWIGALDLSTGLVTFVNAGHNPPVVVSKAGTEFLRVRGGLVLAGLEGSRYRTGTLQLDPGDLLFLYTDGVTEGENAAHQLYGEDRLLRCLETLPAGADPVERVRADLADHVQGFDQFDDVTMLCLRYNGPAHT